MKKYFLVSVCCLLLVLPLALHAEVGSASENVIHIDNPLNCGSSSGSCDNLLGLLTLLLRNVIMPIAAVFVVVWIIFSGFKFIEARGKPDKLKEARENLMWSLIGAGILLTAEGISHVVETTVNQFLK